VSPTTQSLTHRSHVVTDSQCEQPIRTSEFSEVGSSRILDKHNDQYVKMADKVELRVCLFLVFNSYLLCSCRCYQDYQFVGSRS